MRARPLMRARHGLGEDVGRRPFDAVGFPFHDLFERYAVEIGAVEAGAVEIGTGAREGAESGARSTAAPL